MIIKSVYNDYTLYICLPNVHYLSSCFVILFVCNCLPQMPVHSHCALFVIGNEACFSGKYNQLTFPLHLPFTDDARIRRTFLNQKSTNEFEFRERQNCWSQEEIFILATVTFPPIAALIQNSLLFPLCKNDNYKIRVIALKVMYVWLEQPYQTTKAVDKHNYYCPRIISELLSQDASKVSGLRFSTWWNSADGFYVQAKEFDKTNF